MKERLVRKGSALRHQGCDRAGLTESKEDPLAGWSLQLLGVEENARRESAPRGLAVRIIRTVDRLCFAMEDMVMRMDQDTTVGMAWQPWTPDDAINPRRSLAPHSPARLVLVCASFCADPGMNGVGQGRAHTQQRYFLGASWTASCLVQLYKLREGHATMSTRGPHIARLRRTSFHERTHRMSYGPS